MSHTERDCRLASIGCVLAVLMAGCASGGAALGRASPPSYVQPSDGPEVVGTATVRRQANPSTLLSAAAVLQAFAWPITGVDSARGSLDSDWQYFEPAVQASVGRGFCQNPMALRLAVRTVSPQLVRIEAEAYLPRPIRSSGWTDALVPEDEGGRREALEQGRAVLASLRKAVMATGDVQQVALRAWSDFGHELDDGNYRRCAGVLR